MKQTPTWKAEIKQLTMDIFWLFVCMYCHDIWWWIFFCSTEIPVLLLSYNLRWRAWLIFLDQFFIASKIMHHFIFINLFSSGTKFIYTIFTPKRIKDEHLDLPKFKIPEAYLEPPNIIYASFLVSISVWEVPKP